MKIKGIAVNAADELERRARQLRRDKQSYAKQARDIVGETERDRRMFLLGVEHGVAIAAHSCVRRARRLRAANKTEDDR